MSVFQNKKQVRTFRKSSELTKMAENLEISNYFLTKIKFKVKRDLDRTEEKSEQDKDEVLPIFSERFENLDPPCFSCKRDKSMDMVLCLYRGYGLFDGSFEIDIALPSEQQRFEIVDLHDVQISLFEKNESKLATFNQKFPENLGRRDEGDDEDGLLDDVYSFKINDILKIYTRGEIQDKFEYAIGHILVSYKSLEPKVNDGLTAIDKIYDGQAEETVSVLKLPDSEDEHNEDDMERNVAKVKIHNVEITKYFFCSDFT